MGANGLLLGKEGEGKPSAFLFGRENSPILPLLSYPTACCIYPADTRASGNSRAAEDILPCNCVLLYTTKIAPCPNP